MQICFHKYPKRIFTYVNIAKNHSDIHHYSLIIR
ncbi:unknown [Bacteroides sp. CAG:598]|nr:unknown [Bacteroides sp. CAG:598]